jgi:uncharacterized 2Fe-2S/4Fe-4S cluster protein (DUF4445 family)
MRVKLLPAGTLLELERGAWLHGALAPHGVEFPCGGAGICQGCRVRVVEGALEITAEMRSAFTSEELAAGWRLACRARVEGPLALEVAQWSAPTLAAGAAAGFEPGEGVGVAIDLGTTTLAAQSVDLATGRVLGTETALNPQAAHGADVMSRVGFALQGGAGRLAELIRAELGRMIAALPGGRDARRITLAGNTVMHHLFCGLDVKPLSHAPFETPNEDEQVFRAEVLGWRFAPAAEVRFLPCLGGFVGSDILAGIMATGMDRAAALSALIDLGTNGEIAVGGARGILCASTAAGPAFEAANIRMGMRAAEGAISHVTVLNDALHCVVIGEGAPRGVCGSGLVAAAAAGLELGEILPSGRLANGARELPLAAPVSLTQGDIRQLQLAKAAIAAGLRILQEKCGVSDGDLSALHLAGAFGNYVDLASARRIGLLETGATRIHPVGNASLHGAKLALLAPHSSARRIQRIRKIARHISLAADAGFMDAYTARMAFN